MTVDGPVAGRSSAEFHGIQALRGVAASMVVLLHATIQWSQYAGNRIDSPGWLNGGAGVDIFFVISGFVMMLSSGGERSKKRVTARAFLERRFVRVFPLYWLATFILLAKLWIFRLRDLGSQIEHPAMTATYVLSSLFLIPFRNSLGRIGPALGVGWTLSFEMFFYLLFALSLALEVRVTKFLTPTMLCLGLIGFFREPSWPTLTWLVDPLLLEFLAGLLLGRAVQRGYTISPRVALCCGLLGALLILAGSGEINGITRIFRWGIPATLIALSLVGLEKQLSSRLPKQVLLLGDASYSLYLTHNIVLAFFARIGGKLGLLGQTGRLNEMKTALVVLSLCIGFALLVYRYVEMPMNEWLRYKLQLRSIRSKPLEARFSIT